MTGAKPDTGRPEWDVKSEDQSRLAFGLAVGELARRDDKVVAISAANWAPVPHAISTPSRVSDAIIHLWWEATKSHGRSPALSTKTEDVSIASQPER